uniref:Uncharacterized protein n=1 Tax=Rhizophora mucronata TaxID=61149 RepID=A0A2P2K8T0_RHIMU
MDERKGKERPSRARENWATHAHRMTEYDICSGLKFQDNDNIALVQLQQVERHRSLFGCDDEITETPQLLSAQVISHATVLVFASFCSWFLFI